jgi:hypothetical protein
MEAERAIGNSSYTGIHLRDSPKNASPSRRTPNRPGEASLARHPSRSAELAAATAIQPCDQATLLAKSAAARANHRAVRMSHRGHTMTEPQRGCCAELELVEMVMGRCALFRGDGDGDGGYKRLGCGWWLRLVSSQVKKYVQSMGKSTSTPSPVHMLIVT